MTDQQTSRTNITEALRELIRVSKSAGMNAASEFGYLPSYQQADDEEITEVVQLVYAAIAAEPRSDAPDVDTDEYPNRKRRRLTEPRSDAVTAPEPRCTCQRKGCRYPHKDFCWLVKAGVVKAGERDASPAPDEPSLDGIEVEPDPVYWQGFRDGKARAASASVPPLHTDDAGSPLGSTTEGTSFGPKPAGDVSGELGLRDASLASAIVTESVTSTVPPLDVERLASVLAEHFGPSYFPGQQDVTIFGSSPREVAEKIAAAYAAETPEQGRGDE